MPGWITGLAIVSLLAAGVSALVILGDIIGHRQQMAIMNVVWPVTALYFGPLAIWAYWSFGRQHAAATAPSRHRDAKHAAMSESMSGHELARPFWQTVFIGVTHCGAGCTLGDILGEWAIFALGITIGGIALWPEFIADYILAYALGIIFQYFAIAPMRGLGFKDGIWAAIKADTLSLTAFEIGLFGWMAFASFVLFQHHVHPDSPVYWFSMQFGMVLGFITSCPANWWLIKRGIKESM